MEKNFKKTVLMTAIMAVITMMLISLPSCIRIGLVGSGNVVQEQRDVGAFDSISVSTGLNLFIEQTGTESLMIEAEDNILPKIESRVRNNTLEIKIAPLSLGGINARAPINCYVTVRDIKQIDVSSGASLETDLLVSKDLLLDLSSGSEGYLEIDVENLEVDLSSGSSMEISGNAIAQYADISSGSDYDAQDLKSEEATIDASSGSIAKINVSKRLDTDISSGSIVRYSGSPEVITDISSGGSLESISE